MELSSVKAVVTGGASGLGRATAAQLVAAGAHVALLDRQLDENAYIRPGLGDAGDRMFGTEPSAWD